MSRDFLFFITQAAFRIFKFLDFEVVTFLVLQNKMIFLFEAFIMSMLLRFSYLGWFSVSEPEKNSLVECARAKCNQHARSGRGV